MAMGCIPVEEPAAGPALPLVRLNHVSFQCASVAESAEFYQRVLGFELVKRPASLDFEGAW
jgi:catechol-2,3-dioxygenase